MEKQRDRKVNRRNERREKNTFILITGIVERKILQTSSSNIDLETDHKRPSFLRFLGQIRTFCSMERVWMLSLRDPLSANSMTMP
jgi:hypothetical protein